MVKSNRTGKVRLLSFDLDGILVDGGGSREAILNTCRLLATKTDVDSTKLLKENGQVWQNYWPQVEDKWTLGAISGTAETRRGRDYTI